VTERWGVNAEREQVIREMLVADPTTSDRSIARALGIHHSLPNRVRHEMAEDRELPANVQPAGVTECSVDLISDLERRVGELRQHADQLRWESVERTRELSKLWALAGQLEGELFSLRQ
jgi:hypothetical protein